MLDRNRCAVCETDQAPLVALDLGVSGVISICLGHMKEIILSQVKALAKENYPVGLAD